MNALERVQEAAMGMRAGADWIALNVDGRRLVVWHAQGWIVGDRDSGRCLAFDSFAAAFDSIADGFLP